MQCKIPNSFNFRALVANFLSCAIATPSLFRRLLSSLSAHVGRRSSFGVLPSSLLLLLGECCRLRHIHSVLPGWTFYRLLWCYLGMALDHPGAAVDCMIQFSATCVYTRSGLNVKSAVPALYFHLLPMDRPGENPLPCDYSAFSCRQERRRGPVRLFHR